MAKEKANFIGFEANWIINQTLCLSLVFHFPFKQHYGSIPFPCLFYRAYPVYPRYVVLLRVLAEIVSTRKHNWFPGKGRIKQTHTHTDFS